MSLSKIPYSDDQIRERRGVEQEEVYKRAIETALDLQECADRVRSLHDGVAISDGRKFCRSCSSDAHGLTVAWPCTTVRLLDGE